MPPPTVVPRGTKGQGIVLWSSGCKPCAPIFGVPIHRDLTLSVLIPQFDSYWEETRKNPNPLGSGVCQSSIFLRVGCGFPLFIIFIKRLGTNDSSGYQGALNPIFSKVCWCLLLKEPNLKRTLHTMTSSLVSSVSDLLSPVLADEGIELVDVEYQVDTLTLKLLIYKPGGISIADCQQVSRIANPILDVHGMILGAYNLEVASPGLNRPLITEADFRRNLGQKVQVEVSTTTKNCAQLNGTLNQVSDGRILLTLCSGKTVQIAIADIVQAQIQLMW